MDRITDIKALRQRIGLTQKELADAVEVQPNTVARWERGELTISAPMMDRIERVASSHRSGSASRGLRRHARPTPSGDSGLSQTDDWTLMYLKRARSLCSVSSGRRWSRFVAAPTMALTVPLPTGQASRFPLVATTGEKLDDNLSRSIKRIEHTT